MKKLESFLEAKFPGTKCVCSYIDELQQPLFSEEKVFLEKCLPKRKREFTAGRSAARLAMQKIGLYPQQVLPGTHREPLWPESMVGSISHTDDICICLLAKADSGLAIGVDMEVQERINEDLFKSLFTNSERKRLFRLSTEERPVHATSMFSAKEAFFKFQYPMTGKFLGFEEVECSIDREKITIEILNPEDCPSLRHKYYGFMVKEKNLLLTAFCSLP